MNQDEGLVRRFYRTEEGDKKLREAIIREEREEARNEGLAAGIEKNRREMVVNFNSQGVSLDIISKATGLDIDEVKAIIEQSKNN